MSETLRMIAANIIAALSCSESDSNVTAPSIKKGHLHAPTTARVFSNSNHGLSPRNADSAAALAAMWPDRITVAQNNQEVVDMANVVCVAVLPSQCQSVLRALVFSADHTVLSFVSTANIADIQPAVFPAATVVRAIPMPPIAKGAGPLPIYPRNSDVARIFDNVGALLVLDDETEFAALLSVSALMAPFYYLQHAVESWVRSKGVTQVVSVGGWRRVICVRMCGCVSEYECARKT